MVLELSPSPLDPPIEVIAQLSPNLLPTSLADHSDEPKTFVALRQGRHFLTTFHPELTNDDRFHEYFIKKCVIGPWWSISYILSLVRVLLVPTWNLMLTYASLENDKATYLVCWRPRILRSIFRIYRLVIFQISLSYYRPPCLTKSLRQHKPDIYESFTFRILCRWTQHPWHRLWMCGLLTSSYLYESG